MRVGSSRPLLEVDDLPSGRRLPAGLPVAVRFVGGERRGLGVGRVEEQSLEAQFGSASLEVIEDPRAETPTLSAGSMRIRRITPVDSPPS